MRGFKSHDTARRFCREHGELRDLLRPRHRHNQTVSASLRRFRFARGAQAAIGIMQNTRSSKLPRGTSGGLARVRTRTHQRAIWQWLDG